MAGKPLNPHELEELIRRLEKRVETLEQQLFIQIAQPPPAPPTKNERPRTRSKREKR
jgi:hypothetical protein